MRFLFAILFIAAFLVVSFSLSITYEWLRKKYNKPYIGFECFLIDMLRRGDYVSIQGEVMLFDHIARSNEVIDDERPPLNSNKTLGNELLFYTNPNLVWRRCYDVTALRKCDFIYGKYGLKWATSLSIAKTSKEKVEEFENK